MTPSRDTTNPILPKPVGEDGLIPDNGDKAPAQRPQHDRDDDVSAEQGRVMSEDERLDEALEETFPTSDPIAPSRIDGPRN
ncbi:hypothetical protein [Aureimonas sp. AU4]|uniref:hypothetical protein n=1 Tax=Aureimonas sp. AU4 TaxID=1638163 RepID=UPI00078462B1|nr:hypothetical protein [Aureimonas sp. AU4]